MRSLGRGAKPALKEGKVMLTEAEVLLQEDPSEESKHEEITPRAASGAESQDDSCSSSMRERPRRGRPAFRPFDLPSRQPLKRWSSSEEQSEEAAAQQAAV